MTKLFNQSNLWSLQRRNTDVLPKKIKRMYLNVWAFHSRSEVIKMKRAFGIGAFLLIVVSVVNADSGYYLNANQVNIFFNTYSFLFIRSIIYVGVGKGIYRRSLHSVHFRT